MAVRMYRTAHILAAIMDIREQLQKGNHLMSCYPKLRKRKLLLTYSIEK